MKVPLLCIASAGQKARPDPGLFWALRIHRACNTCLRVQLSWNVECRRHFIRYYIIKKANLMSTRIIGTLLACALVTGCAGMADATAKFANVGVIEQEKSTFDGANLIKMTPAFLYREGATFGVPYKLGAQWNSKAPDQVALVLSHQSNISAGGSAFVAFNSLSINIDGSITTYRTTAPTSNDSSSYNTVTRTIYTASTNSVVLPLSELRKMLAARDCRIRIESSKGYEDAQFTIERIPGGQATAIVPLREFIAKIDAARS
jgi:hypothetical protein